MSLAIWYGVALHFSCMKPATLVDIARHTKTSVSTVSRVLAGGEVGRRIGHDTTQRVREAAKLLGYRPNLIARTLRTRRSHTVALLVSDIANPFFSSIGSLVEQSLHQQGYSLMLCNSGEDPQREQEYLQLLAQKAIDGLIVVPTVHTRNELMQNIPHGLPLVLLDRQVEGINSSVYSDQEASTNLLAQTLKRVGVKTIAIAVAPSVVTHRIRGETMAAWFEVISREEGPPLKDTGRRAFIHLSARPDAIICTNNAMADGVIECIADINHPPIIATYDALPVPHLLPIPMAIAMQDIPALAEECVRQLMRQLKDEGYGDAGCPTVLSARIVTNRAFDALPTRV